MTRESAGTRVNSSGLVETVELLGSEEVVNGDFATDSDWNTSATGISIAGGKLSRDATATLSIVQPSSVITPSVTYKITFEIVDYTSGTLTPRFGYNGTGGTAVSGVGTYTQIITKINQNVIELYGTAFIGSVDNVSVKEYTANNLARVDYDGTASSLLVEPERTNLIQYSEDFSQWTTSGTTPTLTTGQLSPSGEPNATKISGTIGSSLIYLAAASTSTATRTIYARTVSGTGTARLMSYYNNSNNLFTLTEEWQRFELTGTITNSANYYIDFRDSSQTLSEFIIWGGQSEEGYPTSYIPTDGSTVTRVQDQYSKTGISNLINSEEGVLFVEIAALSESNLNSYITIGQNTSTGILGISFYTGSNNILLDHWSSGASETYHLQPMSDVTEFNKIAICYNGTSIKGYINGSPVWNTTVTAWSSNTLSELNFAFGSNGGNKFLGKVKQLQIFKTALTDPELAALTS